MYANLGVSVAATFLPSFIDLHFKQKRLSIPLPTPEFAKLPSHASAQHSFHLFQNVTWLTWPTAGPRMDHGKQQKEVKRTDKPEMFNPSIE